MCLLACLLTPSTTTPIVTEPQFLSDVIKTPISNFCRESMNQVFYPEMYWYFIFWSSIPIPDPYWCLSELLALHSQNPTWLHAVHKFSNACFCLSSQVLNLSHPCVTTMWVPNLFPGILPFILCDFLNRTCFILVISSLLCSFSHGSFCV